LPSGSPFNDGVTTQVFRVTDASGNSSTCSFNVTVNPLPDILVDGSVNDSAGLGLGAIMITPVGGTAPYVFIWRKDGVFFSNEEDLDSLNAGVYTLLIIDAKGCQTQLAPIGINNTVSAGEPDDTVFLRLWPNPARESFRLELDNLQLSSAMILNAQGRLVQILQPADWQNEIEVGLLPAGLYYLKATTDDGKNAVVKWIKAD
jgi:hypothetical protein